MHIKGITLDLVIISAESHIHVLTASEVHPLLPTDHLTDIQHTVQSRQRSKSTYVFDYSKANFEGLCNHLLESDFSDCFILDNMENVWTKIKWTILSAMHMYFPKVKLKPCTQENVTEVYKYISSMIKQDAIPHTVTFGSSVATSEYEKVICSTRFSTQFLLKAHSTYHLWTSYHNHTQLSVISL